MAKKLTPAQIEAALEKVMDTETGKIVLGWIMRDLAELHKPPSNSQPLVRAGQQYVGAAIAGKILKIKPSALGELLAGGSHTEL